MLDIWLKPEYMFNPTQVVKQLFGNHQGRQTVVLPWGLPITVDGDELIGSAITRLGIYDLLVTESIWRLLEPGDIAIDAGGNIGYMSSVMAARVGQSGHVTTFEPHPKLYEILMHNIRSWNRSVRAYRLALSDRIGEVHFVIPESFHKNNGIGFVSESPHGQSIVVQSVTLDSFIPEHERIALMKVDVEGHEYAVFKGASNILRHRSIRDIVFEDHTLQISPAKRILMEHGYTLFGLRKTLWGPRLTRPEDSDSTFDPPSFIATVHPKRLKEKFESRGWKCLKHHPT